MTKLAALRQRLTGSPQLRTAFSFIAYLWQRVDEDDCLHSASALTYISLFALVPLVTVAYAMLGAVPVFADLGERIQVLIFTHFVPSTGEEIANYLSQFSEQARNLRAAGIAVLMVTAITTMMKIEQTLNHIWRVPRGRSMLSSLLLYWAVLSFGPLLVGLAFAITTYLMSFRSVLDRVDLLGISSMLWTLAPWLLTSSAFALLFAAVPNCRVPARHALLGGAVAGLCFEVAKYLFARIVAHASYQMVYGAFAALPLFLLWIWLSWAILLAGAEFVHALSSFGGRKIGHIPGLVVALAILQHLWKQHQQGLSVTERDLLQQNWLLGRYSLSHDRWVTARDQLAAANLIKRTESGAYVVGRDLHCYSLWDLVEHLDLLPRELARLAHYPDPWLQRSRTVLESLREYNRRQLDVPLAQLFDTAAATDPAPDTCLQGVAATDRSHS
ncbi:MAG: YihY family inner membrane protein [Spongiibacteraceae bacterium]|jgi:membrane protein|nr:YihY family inner membrane protein [Spongiibacteraceae bacterium]